LVISWQICDTQRPCYKSFAMTIKVVDCYLPTQFFRFRESVLHNVKRLVAILNIF
jgi:hypothetical protein